MSLFKTGHKDFPSLSNYSALVEAHGPDSSQDQVHLSRFLSDTTFVSQAEAVRDIYLMKQASDQSKTKTS